MNNQDKNTRAENEQKCSSNEASESTPIYLNDDTTLQTPQENRHDKSIAPRKDDRMDVSNDDLHETHADRMAGSDRAGTAERKDNQVENNG